jgi:hypothetical protein
MRTLWRNIAGSLATLVQVPPGAELWYDDRDIMFLQEDRKDAAQIQKTQSETLHTYIAAGFEPDSAIEAASSGDIKRLVHTGLYSVQLQAAGTIGEGKGAVQQGVVTPAKDDPSKNGKASDQPALPAGN